MKFNAIHIIIYTLFLALLPACELIHDDLPETKAEGAPVYIRLTISTGGEMGTKANPTGGEEGDGREPGETFEDAVKDLYLFFYQVAEGVTDGVNADANTPIVTYKYFTINNDYTQHGANISTAPVEIEGLSVGQTYHVLVVTNVGQDLPLEETGMTLGSLRDDLVKTAWTVSEGTTTTYSDFVMTNESDASFTIENNTSPANPTTVTVEVERLAARVDYRVAESYVPTENEGDKVEIMGATLVNNYVSPTYFLKRLEKDSKILYLEDEPSTNTYYYVLDPNTNGTKDNGDYHIYTPDIPMEPTDGEKGTITYWTNHVAWNHPSSFIKSKDNNNLEYGFLSYTHEHINTAVAPTWKGTDGKVVTGIVFKATYQHQGFIEGGTFYIYREKFYQTIEDIKKEYSDISLNENATPAECWDLGISKYVDGICYYTYWIKHANDGDNTKVSPMEYAIVRNNIYQLNVTSVAGPGGVVPGNNLIEIVVAVQQWTKADDESVDLK